VEAGDAIKDYTATGVQCLIVEKTGVPFFVCSVVARLLNTMPESLYVVNKFQPLAIPAEYMPHQEKKGLWGKEEPGDMLSIVLIRAKKPVATPGNGSATAAAAADADGDNGSATAAADDADGDNGSATAAAAVADGVLPVQSDSGDKVL
jgi:hypothetical protein